MGMKLSLAALALTPVLAIGPAFAADQAKTSTTTTSTTTTAATAPVNPPKAGRAVAETEARLADLKEKLQITPAEQSAWDDFASTMRENAAATDQLMQQRKEEGNLTALAHMQSYAQFTKANADNVQRLLPKFETLYNALTPVQQKAADEAFAQARHKMMMRHG